MQKNRRIGQYPVSGYQTGIDANLFKGAVQVFVKGGRAGFC